MEKQSLEDFAKKYDVAIYVNHISNYNGPKTVHGNKFLSTSNFEHLRPDLLITIGGHLGDYPLDGKLKAAKIEHWRVSLDGQYSDTYNSLTKVFECPESYFFNRMCDMVNGELESTYYQDWQTAIETVSIPEELPLSHAYIAKHLTQLVPPNAILHFGILSSLRNWELFELEPSVRCYSNVAGFGIDGDLSTFIGQSVTSDVISFLIIGDLAFFYDMNIIGNRHIRNNIRIVLINNNGGGEFRLFTHTADSFGDSSNRHIAASGHFGESAEGWVRNNGFDYLAVRSKEEVATALDILVKPAERPVLLEVFTSMKDDSNALEMIIRSNDHYPKSGTLKQVIKDSLPEGVKKTLKTIIGR